MFGLRKEFGQQRDYANKQISTFIKLHIAHDERGKLQMELIDIQQNEIELLKDNQRYLLVLINLLKERNYRHQACIVDHQKFIDMHQTRCGKCYTPHQANTPRPRPRPNLYCTQCHSIQPHTHTDMFGDIVVRCTHCDATYKVGDART